MIFTYYGVIIECIMKLLKSWAILLVVLTADIALSAADMVFSAPAQPLNASPLFYSRRAHRELMVKNHMMGYAGVSVGVPVLAVLSPLCAVYTYFMKPPYSQSHYVVSGISAAISLGLFGKTWFDIYTDASMLVQRRDRGFSWVQLFKSSALTTVHHFFGTQRLFKEIQRGNLCKTRYDQGAHLRYKETQQFDVLRGKCATLDADLSRIRKQRDGYSEKVCSLRKEVNRLRKDRNQWQAEEDLVQSRAEGQRLGRMPLLQRRREVEPSPQQLPRENHCAECAVITCVPGAKCPHGKPFNQIKNS